MKTPTLGQNIQAARRARGLSQEQLAERIGISRQALGKWENDTALPGLDNLQALAEALGVSVDALLGLPAPRAGAQAASPAAADAGAAEMPQGGTASDAAPALTADTVQALLDAREAAARRRLRLPIACALFAIAVLALLAALAVPGLRRRQSELDALQGRLGSLEGQLAALQGQVAVLGAQTPPAEPAQSGLVSRWDCQPQAMPAAGSFAGLVWVELRQSQPGTQVTLLADCGTGTEACPMERDETTGRYTAPLQMVLERDYTLSIRLDRQGETASEVLGELRYEADYFAVQVLQEADGTAGPSFNRFSYSHPLGAADGTARLLCLPQRASVYAPPFLTVEAVRAELWIDGAPADSAPLVPEGGEVRTWDAFGAVSPVE